MLIMFSLMNSFFKEAISNDIITSVLIVSFSLLNTIKNHSLRFTS